MTVPLPSPPRVLLVEDDPDDAELIRRALHHGGLAIESRVVANEAELRAELETFGPDLALVDWNVPGFSGAAAVTIIREWDARIPVILISGTVGEVLVRHALRVRATDYVSKQNLDALAPAVARALAEVEGHRERARLEQELAADQARLRTAIDAMLEGVAVLSAVRDEAGRIVDFRFTYCNAAIGTISRGNSKAGHTLLERLPAHRTNGLFDAYVRVVETGVPFDSGPFRYVDPDAAGGRLDQIVEHRAVKMGDGYVVSVRDMTERHEAEREMRRLSTAIEQSADAVVITDTAPSIVYVNPAFVRITGYDPAEAVGQNPRFLQSGQHTPDFYARMWATLTSGETWRGEMHNRRKDGSLFVEDATITPVRDEDGTLVNYVAVKRDVTDRKVAEEAVARSRAELAEAQRIAHVGSWARNPAGDTTAWSDEMFRIYGIDPDRGAPTVAELSRFYDPKTFARRNAVVDRAFAMGEPYEIEYDITRADGSVRRLIARGEPVVGPDGALAVFRGTVADITELREAQAHLDRARRAEMVGRLAAGAAHDYNNALAAISGYAELLGATIPMEDPRHADVEAIQEAVARASALTRQLLAFGRRQELDPSVVDVGEAVRGIEPMLRSLVGADVDLVVTLGGSGRVLVDRGQLEQVVTNLVINARDAMPRGGLLSIETADEEVATGDERLRAAASPGAFVRLTVTDSGSGMDAVTLAHIFEPFYTTKGPSRGTGMGLAIVEGIVAQSGGFVVVESEVGVGATFSVFLPQTGRAASPLEPATAPALAPHGDESILLVDDDSEVRVVTARLLRELGYSVVEARHADEALSIFRAGSPTFDLLLTDVVMPGMGGPQLADQILGLDPGLGTLFVTANAPETVLSDFRGRGTLLMKPYTMDQLAIRVREALDRRPSKAR